jgi:carboxyvinyl-carboxyphosphonate phosphorylmutase
MALAFVSEVYIPYYNMLGQIEGDGRRDTMTFQHQAFSEILMAPRCGSPAPVFDPLSARIAQEAGFEVAFLAGSSVSLQVLGAPDLVLVTLSELVEQTRRVARACTLPVLVDADHGFGNALNVMRAVEDLAQAGAAALTIEDTALPAAFGRAGGPELISIQEAVGKIRAACHAAQSAPIAVVARTDIGVAGLEDGLLRIRQYSKEGATAIFVSGVKSRTEVDAISEATSLPLILGAVPADLQDNDYLAARRVRLFNLGHQPLRASIEATIQTMLALRNASPLPVDLATPETIERLSRGSLYSKHAATFLKSNLAERA